MSTTAPDLTADEAIARARALVPLLVAEQAETEARGHYSPELHQAFVNAGLYQLTHPKKYGGHQFGLDTFFRVVAEVSRGCASTGMLYCLSAGHTIALAAYWPEEVQEDVLSQGPFIAPLTVEPELRATRTDGGWNVTGTVSTVTGIPYANFFWGHALADENGPDGEPLMLQVLVPRASWTIADSGNDTVGMRGSGTGDIVVDGFVPSRYVLEDSNFLAFELVDGSTLGARLHDDTLYVGRAAGWFSTNFTAIGVGIAQAAVDAYGELMPTETLKIPPVAIRQTDADALLAYGDGIGRVAAEEMMLLGGIANLQRAAASGSFSDADDLLLARLSLETVSHCWGTVSALVKTSGTTQMQRGSRMERIYRDFSQLYFHDGYILEGDTAARDLARLRLGLTPSPGERTLLG